MSLTLSASISAMAPGLSTSVVGQGGVEPYVYSVAANGAGGTIDPTTGVYQAPATMNPNPKFTSDTLVVTDDNGDTASVSILVADPLFLFCEILAKEMGLSPNRVYLWDQKSPMPSDAGLFIAVSVLTCKPFGNTISFDGSGSGLDAVQSINMLATLSINAISRSTEALLRKEEILLALASLYSESQQELNSFNIGKLPPGGQFVNLSNIDGAAIPYRFNISINMQYFVRKIKAVPYFDDFAQASVVTEP